MPDFGRESDYDEDESEDSDGNRALARPGLDFFAEEGQIIFESGQTHCVAFIKLLYDSLAGQTEQLKLVIKGETGSAIDVCKYPQAIAIIDAE